MVRIKRALISVSDKTGIVELARVLKKYNVEIISTGGTAKVLKEAGVPVIDISEVTGFPEMLDGRVKTLHPKIHGGLLALRDKKEHMEQIKKYNIDTIDMVVVNLYPFTKTVSKPNVQLEDAIENIDIGGPSMIRSAAKNSNSVVVVVDPKFYPLIVEEIEKNNGAVSDEVKRRMMVEVFKHTYEYDRNIYNFFSQKFLNPDIPEVFNLSCKKLQGLRYGENPHQKAGFYIDENLKEPSISSAKQIHGKELSYNNIMDANSAIELIKEFEEPACTIIKHTNPCGTAIGKDIDESFFKAYETDPVSAFGGVIALNREVTIKIAEYISTRFIELVISPKFDEQALEILKKKKDIRLLEISGLDSVKVRNVEYDLRKVVGGLLIQERDLKGMTGADLKVVTKKSPSKKEIKDLLFGWKVVKHVKSNAIVIVKDGVTLGVGAGQMNRVGSVKIAVEQAGEKAKGASLVSDAMFPKSDAIEVASKGGITSIIQTGGSIKDKEVIEAADKFGLVMVFTGIRHFKH
ncbi:MAG: bifunctional phosphoribosylaminoimidazolecarboxamide formyltransferase/IMP cyclohydrolase [Candidatus Firestonebacteria bacterium]